ncbi:hypothetical protein [Jiangella gansuensis]|uniref:hypothetical protein n=1 Tax=Jiangella gansuensis TaxID=281473 RepID=UPI0004BA38DA|nr:hypothetical protein [Jiangella gansuensis]
MSSDYIAQMMHDERGTQLRAEAAADRLARTALRAAKRTAAERSTTQATPKRPFSLLRTSLRRQRGRHAV